MNLDVDSMIIEYVNWLKAEITVSRIGDYYEITAPYLDRNNDYLQIYINMDNDNIVLTDDGYIINNLISEGMRFTTGRKAAIEDIARRFGVKIKNNALTIKSNKNDFPQKKHMLLQAMLTVDDMCMTSQNRVSSFFLEDIEDYFANHDIYCTENVQFTGVSGYVHTYDFVLQRSRTKPERLCRALNNPTKTNVTNILFGWEDTKNTRRNDSKLIVFINDENKIAKGVFESLENYDASIVLWSEREQPINLELLKAS